MKCGLDVTPMCYAEREVMKPFRAWVCASLIILSPFIDLCYTAKLTGFSHALRCKNLIFISHLLSNIS